MGGRYEKGSWLVREVTKRTQVQDVRRFVDICELGEASVLA